MVSMKFWRLNSMSSSNLEHRSLVVLAGSGIGKLSASASVPVSSRHVLVASFTADSLELVLLEGFLLSVLNSRGWQKSSSFGTHLGYLEGHQPVIGRHTHQLLNVFKLLVWEVGSSGVLVKLLNVEVALGRELQRAWQVTVASPRTALLQLVDNESTVGMLRLIHILLNIEVLIFHVLNAQADIRNVWVVQVSIGYWQSVSFSIE